MSDGVGDDDLRVIEDQDVIVAYLAMKPPLCLVEECAARLVVQPGYLQRDDGARVSDDVPAYHVGCAGRPMHVFDKEDLVYFRARVVRVVT